MYVIMENRVAAHGSKGKVTCVTCKLKKCVGRCHFERVKAPKAA
jgi:hypothetical protein